MTNVMEANSRAAPKGEASNSTAATRFIETKLETYAYRRFGGAYAAKFTGKYEHRVIAPGIGHNLPQEAPAAFAQPSSTSIRTHIPHNPGGSNDHHRHS